MLRVVPGQGEVVALSMRLEAFTLHMSEARKVLKSVDLPQLVLPMMYISPEKKTAIIVAIKSFLANNKQGNIVKSYI